MELEKVHLLRILQMPGGTSEILLRGEKNGTETRLYYTEGLIFVERIVQGVRHTRLVPMNNVQCMEEYNARITHQESKAGSSQRLTVDKGKASASRRSSKAETCA